MVLERDNLLPIQILIHKSHPEGLILSRLSSSEALKKLTAVNR